MKLAAILIAFGACALAGLRLSRRLESRAALLTTLREDLETLLHAVCIGRKPLAVLVAERPSLGHGALYAQYCELRKTLTPDAAWQASWQWAVGSGQGAAPRHAPLGEGGSRCSRQGGEDRSSDYTSLTEEEQAAVREILTAFTTCDCETIARRGQGAVALLETRAKAAAAESAAKGRVYRSIGLLLGAAISILML